MTKRSNLPLILVIAGGLLIVGSFGILLLSRPGAPAQSPSGTPGVFPEVPRVSLTDAKAALDSGEAIFVDVRSSQAFEDAHIPGALSIPEGELATRLEELDPQLWIIPY